MRLLRIEVAFPPGRFYPSRCRVNNVSALQPIAEIVHDIDLKESKFKREETVGIEKLVTGIAMARKEDEARLIRSAAVFDDLYEFFKRKHD